MKQQQALPENFPAEPYDRCVSVDGDADRAVYFYLDQERNFHLLDGDRIAILVAGYLKELISNCNNADIQLGLIQTAYANGASTKYITNDLKVPVAIVPTGVKHLHHKALEYDVGVYFEANGHGTVIFSKKAKNIISDISKCKTTSPCAKAAAERLLTVIDVINETVGDAISDMLLVETILHAKGWNIQDWEACYTDLPNRQMKVTVKVRIFTFLLFLYILVKVC